MADRSFETEYKWWEDSEKLLKLEQAFAIGCTDKEACSYAEITENQLYYYENTINTDFRVRKQELKVKPILKAKQTVVKALDEPEHAKWYLERKKKDEFSNRQEITGRDGEDMKLNVIVYGNEDPLAKSLDERPTQLPADGLAHTSPEQPSQI